MSEIKYRLAVDPSGLPAQLGNAERMFGAHSANVSRELDAMRLASVRFGAAHVGEAGRAIEATDRLAAAVGRVSAVTGAVLGGVGLGQMSRAMAGMADEVTGMEGRLKLATHSAREFAQAQADVAGIADRQRAGLSEVGGLYAKTASLADELGASQADVAKFTEAVAASLTLNNTSAEASAGALLQLGQAIGGTTLQAEEFNSILDGARPLLAAAAKHIDGTGGSLSKLKELVSEGKVSSKEFFAAVVAASDELSQSTAKLPLTIGQATTLLRNDALELVGDLDKMSGASERVADSIKGLGGHLDVLAVAGAALAGVMGGRLLQSLGSAVMAKVADRAITAELARTTLLQTEAAVAQATAQIGAAQAMNLGTGSATALAAAEARLLQAQSARAAAQTALTAATSAGGAAATLAGGALGLLGGPLGIALTLLSAGAAAWAIWGGASAKAGDAARSLGQKLDESNQRLAREVELLRERNQLSGQGKKALASGSDEDVRNVMEARRRLVDIESELARMRGMNASTLGLENERYELQFRLRDAERNAEAKAAEQRTAKDREDGDKRTKWLAQMGDKAVQLQQELRKAREEFGGVIPPDIERAIRKKFAEPVKDAAAEMAKAGAKLYGDLTAQGSGLAADFAEKWDSLSAAYRANKITVDELTRAQGLLLEQQPAIKAHLDAQTKASQAAREEVEKLYAETVKAAEQGAKQAVERVAALQLEDTALTLASSANLTLAEAIEQVQIARLQEAAAAARRDGEQERLDAINAEIAARQKLAKLVAGKELRDQGKEAGEALKSYLSKDIGGNLAAGFDKASQSLGSFVSGVRDLAVAQEAQAQAMRDNLKANGGDLAKFAKVQEQITAKGAAQQINAYGNIAGAAKGFFKEGSKGYAALQKAEQVFRAFELAMSAKAIAQRLLEVGTVTAAKVSGDQLSAQSSLSAAATESVASLVKGQAAAVAGVANQASGDPYTAFPRMAAMAAIMAGLGFLIGGLGGGGKAADPGNTGTGTVLGDTTAKSESITNAIEHLARNSDVSLRYSQGMLAALNTIANGISGLSGLIVRDEGLTTGAGFNVQQGTKLPSHISNPALGALLGGPIGLALSVASKVPVLGKLVGALFGTKTTINGTGLYMADQSLGSILDGGATLQNYADVTKKKKAIGFTYSTKSSTQFQGADPLLAQQFSLMFEQFAKGIELAAGPLDRSLDEVRQRLSTFVVSIGKINLQGLTGAQIQERLTAVFGAAADNIAGAALPGLQSFQKVGEGYFETVIRVASGVESAKAALDHLGVSAMAYTDIADKQGDVGTELIRGSLLAWEQARHGLTSGVGEIVESFHGSAEELTQLWQDLATMRDGLRAIGADVASLGVDMIRGAGGMDALSEGLQAYFDNFLTHSERAAEMTRRVSAQFSAAGVAMPASAEGFRQLVKGIDTSTAAGQALFGRVIALSDSFADLQESLKSTGETADAFAEQRADMERQLLQLEGKTQALRAIELAKLDASLKPLQERIWALQDEQAAAQAAAQLASQRQQLDVQLLQLQGKVAEVRAIELAKLDASLRPLQERVWAIQDEQAATQMAAQAAQAAAQAEQQLANQREQLEGQLLQLQGKTAEIRAIELAKLDASLRPLQVRIWALQEEQAATAAAAQAAEAAAQAEQQLANQREQLDEQWLQLQGSTAELRARELARLDASLRPLQQRFWALQDEQAAAAAATQAEQQLASQREQLAGQREQLEAQVLQLQGHTVELRARELARMEESLRPLQQRIWAMQDEQAAAQTAQAVANERAQLEGRLLQLQGKTAELRARELAELDPSNRSLQERVWQLEEEQAAAQQAAQAHQEAVQAAQQLRDAWQSVTDGIAEEVRRIRGLLGTGASESLASLQAQFAITTAAARAGDQEAGKRLPQLSNALLSMAESVASSSEELRRIQGGTLASLEGTLGLLASQYGLTVPKFEAGGNHAGGIRLVGERGPELELTGPSRILNARQTAQVLGGNAGDGDRDRDALLRELQALRAEVAQLRAEQGDGTRAIASHTSRAAKVLERVCPEGDAISTRIVT